MMVVRRRPVSKCMKHALAFTLAAVLLVSTCVALAGKYFDKEDEKGIEHYSNALMAWYEVNQLGLPNSDDDIKRVVSLLSRVHAECAKVSDKTLKKIDGELAKEFRNNLQEGARRYASGLNAYSEAVKNGATPSEQAKSDINSGQQKIVHFHRFYNANIERIVNFLKSKGVDIQ